MRIVNYFLILSIIGFISACKSTQPIVIASSNAFTNVRPAYEVNNAVSESMVYALPKTKLLFSIKVEKRYQRRGPLYQYSKLYLDIDQPVTDHKTEYVLKSIDVRTVGILDNTQRYKVDFSGDTGSGNIELTENGCIKSVNVNLDDEIENVESRSLDPSNPVDTSFVGVPLLEELLRSNSTSKVAQEAASVIYRLRENRVALVSGELEYFPADGESLRLSLQQIDALENDYVSLFTGKIDSEELELNFEYIPEAAVTRETIFRFSKFNGLVASDDFSGSPVAITLIPDHLFNLPDNKPEPTYDEKGNLLEVVEKNGFYYRLPAECTLKLEYNNKSLASKKVKIAQFGKVLSLPADLLDNNKKGIIFFPETGAIKKIVNK